MGFNGTEHLASSITHVFLRGRPDLLDQIEVSQIRMRSCIRADVACAHACCFVPRSLTANTFKCFSLVLALSFLSPRKQRMPLKTQVRERYYDEDHNHEVTHGC